MILGLTLSHNSSACVVNEKGQIVFASSEERFSRRKNDSGFPRMTLEYIFSNICDPHRIKQVAVGDLCRASFHSESFIRFLNIMSIEDRNALFKNPFRLGGLILAELLGSFFSRPKDNFQNLVRKEIRVYLPDAEINFYDHHLCHVSSAYFCSPYQEALAISLDGSGDEISGLVCLGEGSRLKPLFRNPEAASVGTFYKSITSVLGFTPGRHEGKITGLAAYGNPNRFKSNFAKALYIVKDSDSELKIRSTAAEMDGKYNLNLVSRNIFYLLYRHSREYLKSRRKGWDEYRKLSLHSYFIEYYKDILGLDLNRLNTSQDHGDLAAASQIILEEVVVEFVQHFLKIHSPRKLVLAGGVFSNVKLNQRILESTQVEEVVIHPAMGDEGLSVGAAMLELNKKARVLPCYLENVFLGAEYREPKKIEKALREHNLKYLKISEQEMVTKVVDALLRNEIVGVFKSRAEYGPRALGHRSILINPGKRKSNDVVNKRLRRTEFMPFAPMVLKEYFADIFFSTKIKGGLVNFEFMTMTLDVKDEWKNKIPAVVHLDGTARPQIVSKEQNSFCHSVLADFFAATGIPVLVNTSFNMHEEPIVNSPEDAIRSFKTGAVDCLVLEDFFVSIT